MLSLVEPDEKHMAQISVAKNIIKPRSSIIESSRATVDELVPKQINIGK